jgi:filamentous hemagglutinin
MMKKTIMAITLKNIFQTHIIRRTNIMKSLLNNTYAGRSFYVLLISALITVTAFGQNLAITGAPTLNGSGTYNIKGNITNTAPVTFTGTVAVTLSGTAAQTIGTAGNGLITFNGLNVNTTGATPTTTMNVAVDVNTGLSVLAGSTFVVGANQLNLSGNSTLNGTGTLSTVAGSTVVYDQAGTSQAVLGGFTYNGALTLSGTSTKTLGGDVTVAGAFSHSGGSLAIGNNLTISSTTPSFATISDVSTGKTLTLSGTGAKTIAAVTTTTGTGAISNTGASGLLTITTLSGNNGSISGGAGGVTFTNAATNAGTITGGAGLITFSNTLGHGTGTITAGAGGITFGNTVTFASGTITAGTGAQLTFNGNVANSGTAALTLTGSGAASFAGTLNTTGLNFGGTSTVTYNSGSAGQAIADVGYYNLILSNNTKTWTLGAARTIGGNLTLNATSGTTVTTAGNNLNVSGNVSLGSNLTLSGAGALAFANAASAVSGTGFEVVGSVARTHAFVASTAYTFNNATMTITPTTLGTLSSLTIQSNPSTAPTGYLAGNSVNRDYHVSYAGAGFTATMQLAYLAAEYTGSLPSKLKDFNTGIAKANKIAGVYTPGGPTNGFMYVSLPGITTASFASGNEIAIDDRYNIFNSIATALWNAGTTWDVGTIPTATDDAVITGTHTVTVADGATANALSVTIDGSAANTLVVGGGASGILNVGAGGLTNGSSGNTSGVLTVSTGANVNITGNALATFGAITNNGTVTVN